MKHSVGDFVYEISMETGVDVGDVKKVIKALKTCIRRSVIAHTPVVWNGVCKLDVKWRKARMYSHPATQELCLEPEHMNLTAKPSRELAEKVAENRSNE